MTIDINPTFVSDQNQESSARRVAEMLWEVSKGDLSQIPSSYLEPLGFEYSDGTVSLLDQLNKVEFSESATYEEFSEVVSQLVRAEPQDWPYSESIVSIQVDKLLYEIEPEPFEFSEFDWEFADSGDTSKKVELFLKKVISSVYRDGVSSVTDKDGNPPNEKNRYLLSEDGKNFSGIFYDKEAVNGTKKFPFEIVEKSNGRYEIRY